MGKFVITKRTNGEFQFNLKAGNGQTILSKPKVTLQKQVLKTESNL